MSTRSLTALVAGLAIAAGCGGQGGNAADAAFIADMTVHHQGAIQMARTAQERAERQEVRELASSIAAAQAREVAELKRLRDEVGAAGDQMGATHEDMGVETFEGADSFDRAFLDAMISHHEDGVAMSQNLLELGQSSELKELAERMIEAQTAELERMRGWRESWY